MVFNSLAAQEEHSDVTTLLVSTDDVEHGVDGVDRCNPASTSEPIVAAGSGDTWGRLNHLSPLPMDTPFPAFPGRWREARILQQIR